jgi:hypothetical protein
MSDRASCGLAGAATPIVPPSESGFPKIVAAVTLRFLPNTPFAHAAVFLWGAAYLTYYVASEDDYRKGGISRWNAYDAHVVTVAAITACVAVAAGALAAGRLGRFTAPVGGAGAAVLILFAAAFLANSLN